MSTDLKNLPVLVTGGGSGIGRSAAIRFAQAGSKVFLVGRTESKLYAVKQEIKDLYPEVEVDFFVADIKVKDQLSSAVDAAVSRFGGLTVVVANAGVVSTFADSLDSWEATIATNLVSLLRLSHQTLPHLEASVKAHGQASFITISSILGILKDGAFAPYVASKHGINGFTGSLFQAVQDKGIKVTVINPALTDTPMLQAAPFYNKKTTIPPESIAHAIHFAASFPEGGCPTEITVNAQYTH